MTLTDPVDLWVDPIDPVIIEHEWLVNGTPVPGATGERFDALDFGFGPGSYTITAHSFDPTDWVRYNLNLLQQDISWTVLYTTPEPSTAALSAVAAAFLAINRRRR